MGSEGNVNVDQFQADMDKAIQEVIAKHEKSFLFKWALVLDTATAETEDSRGVWILHTPEAVMWDIIGLLRHAIRLTDADLIKEAINDE